LLGTNQNTTLSYGSFGTKNATVTVTSGSQTVTSALCAVNIIPNGSCTSGCGGGGGGGFDQPNVVLFSRPASSSLASYLYYGQSSSTPIITTNPQPHVAGVYLSEVPYTGVTGTTAVTVFLVLLVLWSAFIAYALESRRFSFVNTKFGRLFGRGDSGTDTEYDSDTETPVFQASLPTHSVTQSVAQGSSYRTSSAPSNLPISGNGDEHVSLLTDDVRNSIAERARARTALVSEEAAHLIVEASKGDTAEMFEILESAISHAESKYLKEDGWILLNREKVRLFLEEAGIGFGNNNQNHSISDTAVPQKTESASGRPIAPPVTKLTPPPVANPIRTPSTDSHYQSEKTAMQSTMPASRNVPSGAGYVPPSRGGQSPRVAEFLSAIAAGDRTQVLSLVSAVKSSGVSMDEFVKGAILELDRVHRGRIEGDATISDTEIARIASGWGSDGLEEVIAILLSIAEHSYKSSSTSLKLAVMRIERLTR
jgi:hypothetical protein